MLRWYQSRLSAVAPVLSIAAYAWLEFLTR